MSGQTWIKLEDAKRYLRFDPADTSDDLTLQRIVDAAAAMIEDIKDHVQTGTVVGEVQEVANYGAVFLDERPVASIQAVRKYAGDGTSTTIPEATPTDPTTLTGYRVRGGTAGVLQLSSWGTYACLPGDMVAVDYTFGLDPVPDNYVEAGLELTAHLWKTSQENTSGGRPGIGEPDIEMIRTSGANFALPFRVRELLGIYGSIVKSSGVRIL